ncbi:hypothetical protein HQ545_06300 [Candidatus Woesearchaeota archaeon]|nr:hypothetical protein [Candidatus Woesearchaeota archaeon]
MEMTLEENIQKELATAKERAKAGEAGIMAIFLGTAQNYARRIGQNISTQVTEIQEMGYTNAVPLELATAKENAKAGKAELMNIHLRIAQKYAQKTGKDILTQVTEIQEVGYVNAVPVELATARENAEAGKTGSMEQCLITAQSYAQQTGQDILTKVTEIRALVPK